jgi:hypothetical protein
MAADLVKMSGQTTTTQGKSEILLRDSFIFHTFEIVLFFSFRATARCTSLYSAPV